MTEANLKRNLRGLSLTFAGLACLIVGIGLSRHPFGIRGDFSEGFFLGASLVLLFAGFWILARRKPASKT